MAPREEAGTNGETEEVVNIDHLLNYVNEMQEGAKELIAARDFKTSLQVIQQGLDACGQCEGLPVAADDVPRLVMAKSLLYSSKATVFWAQELYRRAIEECNSAIEFDPNNGLAFLHRARGYERIQEFAKAIDDVEWLQRKEMVNRNFGVMLEFLSSEEMKSTLREADRSIYPISEKEVSGLAERCTPEALVDEDKQTKVKEQDQVLLADWLKVLRKKKEERDETFDDRLEDAIHQGLKELREQFDEVVQRTGLKKNHNLAAEVAEHISQSGGTMKAEKLAAIYQIDEDDADILLNWIQKATRIHEELEQ